MALTTDLISQFVKITMIRTTRRPKRCYKALYVYSMAKPM